MRCLNSRPERPQVKPCQKRRMTFARFAANLRRIAYRTTTRNAERPVILAIAAAAEARNICRLCAGTGWLHGCQRWTPAQMRKGTPYYSQRCDCAAASGKKSTKRRKPK